MDIYHKFTKYTSAQVSTAGFGVTFPPDMRTLVVSNNFVGGAINVDLFTYGPTGGTQSNRIRLGSGTFFLPFQLWGMSAGTNDSNLSYLIGY